MVVKAKRNLHWSSGSGFASRLPFLLETWCGGLKG